MDKINLHQTAIKVKDFLLKTDDSIETALRSLEIEDVDPDDLENHFEDWIARCPHCNCWATIEEFSDGSYYGCSCNSCGNKRI